MSTTATPARNDRKGRLVPGILAVATGALLGAFGTITILELDVAAQQPVTTVDPARWGSPGHVTMSADAIEQWITDRTRASAQAAGYRDPSDPARWGSPGHVTMSADAIEQWIKHQAPAPAAVGPLSADAAEKWITPG
jgi:hypothetical protein